MPSRREKAALLKGERKSASLSAGLLYDFAASHIGIPAGFFVESGGRPIPKTANIYASISHSGRHVACAIEDRPVGIDVQKACCVSQKLMRRICSDYEMEQIDKSIDANKSFQIFWALKEAYYKAAHNPEDPVIMSKTAFRLPNINKAASQKSALEYNGWVFWVWELEAEAIAALCVKERLY